MRSLLISVILVCLSGCCGIKPGCVKIPSKGTASANGISIAYECFGPQQAETILLIQGTGAQLTAWPVNLCRQLASAGYRVIRYDNRDAGLSSKFDSLGMPDWASIFPKIGTCDMTNLPYTLNDMADDAVGLLSTLKIEEAHIVGASMGGAIAQLVTINYPDRVLSLTSIMASSGNPALPQGNPEVLKVMGTPPPETKDSAILTEYLAQIYKIMGSPAFPIDDKTVYKIARQNIRRSWYPEGTARQAAAVIIGDNCDRREKLSRLNIPVVIIHGEADPVVNFAAANELVTTIPGAKLISIPGMGHDLPEALINEIRNGILAAVRSAR